MFILLISVWTNLKWLNFQRSNLLLNEKDPLKCNLNVLFCFSLTKFEERDLLMQDFMTVESTFFPRNGSQQTPAHSHSEFTFRTYAPVAFRYFHKLFGIQREDFLVRIDPQPLETYWLHRNIPQSFKTFWLKTFFNLLRLSG